MRNGNGRALVDPQTWVSDAEQRLKRARELASEFAKLGDERATLDKREDEIMREFEGLGVAAPRRAQTRRTASRRSGAKGRARGNGAAQGGFANLRDLCVLRVLDPEKGMTLDEIEASARKAGWDTQAKKPKVLLLQALRGDMKDEGRVKSGGRGLYLLAAKGVKAREEWKSHPKDAKVSGGDGGKDEK